MEIKIYTLSSTRNLNEVRYVGKTKQSLKRRLSQHLCSARKVLKDNYGYNYNYNWINKEIADGYDIEILEIDSLEFLDNESWEWLEEYWISQLKVWGFNLTNLTTGGDGNKNQVFSKESVEKRASKIRGIPRDEETKKKISEGLKGKVVSEEVKQKIRDTVLQKQGKAVIQYDKFGNILNTWECIADVAKFYKCNPSNISLAAKNTDLGKSSIALNCYWKYADSNHDLAIDKSKYVCQLDLDGSFIKEWYNLNTISKELNLSLSSLLRCCKHKAKKVGNFMFCYYPEYISGEYINYIPDENSINKGRKIIQKDMNGNIINEFPSAFSAYKTLGFGKNEILECCKKERQSFNNFIFEYV